jgi:hypothetical protein
MKESLKLFVSVLRVGNFGHNSYKWARKNCVNGREKSIEAGAGRPAE